MAKQFVFRSAELDGDTMGETEQQMRYRLDDNEDWAQPDIGDYGLIAVVQFCISRLFNIV